MTRPVTIVIATKNKGKVSEFAHAFAKLGIEVKSLLDYPAIPEIIEDGNSFLANAKIKAKTTGDALGIPVLADDSGLTVDALEGEPGIYSARYAGEWATDEQNNEKLIKELLQKGALLSEQPLPDGTRLLSPAQFRCALVLYLPQTKQFIESEGAVHGQIMERARGNGGFGYDPLFFVHELGCSMAELSKEEKEKISHRGEALKQLLPQIEQYVKG